MAQPGVRPTSSLRKPANGDADACAMRRESRGRGPGRYDTCHARRRPLRDVQREERMRRHCDASVRPLRDMVVTWARASEHFARPRRAALCCALLGTLLHHLLRMRVRGCAAREVSISGVVPCGEVRLRRVGLCALQGCIGAASDSSSCERRWEADASRRHRTVAFSISSEVTEVCCFVYNACV